MSRRTRRLSEAPDLAANGGSLAIELRPDGVLELVRLSPSDRRVAALSITRDELSALADLAYLAELALEPPRGARAPGPSIYPVPDSAAKSVGEGWRKFYWDVWKKHLDAAMPAAKTKPARKAAAKKKAPARKKAAAR